MPNLVMRTATADDAGAIDALIRAHQSEGHLLPRNAGEIRRRASEFVVCEEDGRIQACAALAPLSTSVAEVRSLVVSDAARGAGLATRLVEELRRRARAAGFETLSAFTHDARFFVRQNFSIVPPLWLPEKVAKDCAGCPLFRACGQHAMVLPLWDVARSHAARIDERRVAVA